MLCYGLVSPLTGPLIARTGGRTVMMAGTFVIVLGCFLMAFTHSTTSWVAVWLLMGAGMRLALYDAAFALLVEIAGAEARRAITLVTLLGGLASVAFWPAGAALLHFTDWRHAIIVYGCAGIVSLLFLTTVPAGYRSQPPVTGQPALQAIGPAEDRKAFISVPVVRHVDSADNLCFHRRVRSFSSDTGRLWYARRSGYVVGGGTGERQTAGRGFRCTYFSDPSEPVYRHYSAIMLFGWPCRECYPGGYSHLYSELRGCKRTEYDH